MKTVTEQRWEEFLDAHPLVVPDGFKVNGSYIQTHYFENGIEIARMSKDSQGVFFEIEEDV